VTCWLIPDNMQW